ncbi:TniQ family protein [Cytobacillus oceanisediminis]|uniref:TniQ family protein n=1 Tax=Cytobacillus oceanisediminis TaxID=665099 RepID=UPI002079A978|nr:TniQ family protein [Cytobacillus oceanisediminis]USK44095.1 TniQ family protein [Cytobacillus oceanisediminis]
MNSKKISVRIPANPDECLTSWLMRTCFANNINIKDLFSQISGYYSNSDFRTFHQLDVNPYRVLNFKIAANLLDKSINYIEKLTFNEVLLKFHNFPDLFYIDKTKAFFKDAISIKYRRFCISCLKNDIYYKLNWQISNITHCQIHNEELTHKCTACNQCQPYYHENLMYCRCKYCNKSLVHGFLPRQKSNNPQKRELSYWFEQQWNFLIDSNNTLQPNTCEKKKRLVILFLFICGDMNSKFDPRKIKYISRDYKYKLINFICSSENKNGSFEINLPLILKTLKAINISIENFISINIPNTYTETLEDYIQKNSVIKCLTPWCPDYDSPIKFIKVNKFRSKTHLNIHICSSCSIKYGVNKKTKTWEEYGDLISLGYKIVLPLLNSGHHKLYIANKIGISRLKLTKIISYLTLHNLITEVIINNYTPKKNIAGSTIDYFKNYLNSTETQIINTVMKQNDWSRSDAYYHFFNPSVQIAYFNISKTNEL